jgi:hypothetical protein
LGGFLGFYEKIEEKPQTKAIYMPFYPIFDHFFRILENSLARRVLATGARNETYSAFIHGLRWVLPSTQSELGRRELICIR